jgi:pimeloyl-ACP methyl ester carboxylesterase
MQGPFHNCATCALLLLAGCAHLRPATAPMRTVAYREGDSARTLIVLLPGRRDSPEDFGRFDFPALAARAGVVADMVAVDAHLGYYYHRTIVERLHEDVIAPARKRYARIWLAGISIGGTGSLLYAAEHPQNVDGILLLAPYLGEKDLIDEVAAAGGLRGWSPPARLAPDDFQLQLWVWLKSYFDRSENRPPLYLGYGRSDSFARADGLLGGALPPGHVLTAPGGHDWRTWKELWKLFLRTGALSGTGRGRQG